MRRSRCSRFPHQPPLLVSPSSLHRVATWRGASPLFEKAGLANALDEAPAGDRSMGDSTLLGAAERHRLPVELPGGLLKPAKMETHRRRRQGRNQMDRPNTCTRTGEKTRRGLQDQGSLECLKTMSAVPTVLGRQVRAANPR